jgi:hypothetical protein
LDARATNHIRVHDMVYFGDGSMANIEGRGTILIQCKNGGHKVLTGVFNILRLTVNIISLRQLEEATYNYKIMLHDGYLKLWDRAWSLANKVKCAPNMLYILYLDVNRPVCLAAQGASPAWRWNARFEHLNFCTLMWLAEG